MLTLLAGTTTARGPLDLTVPDHGGALTVRVLKDGNPSANVPVALLEQGFVERLWSRETGNQQELHKLFNPIERTDKDGVARFTDLYPCLYQLRASEDGSGLSDFPIPVTEGVARAVVPAVAIAAGEKLSMTVALHPEAGSATLQALRPDGTPPGHRGITFFFGMRETNAMASMDFDGNGIGTHRFTDSGLWAVGLHFRETESPGMPTNWEPYYQGSTLLPISPGYKLEAPVKLTCDPYLPGSIQALGWPGGQARAGDDHPHVRVRSGSRRDRPRGEHRRRRRRALHGSDLRFLSNSRLDGGISAPLSSVGEWPTSGRRDHARSGRLPGGERQRGGGDRDARPTAAREGGLRAREDQAASRRKGVGLFCVPVLRLAEASMLLASRSCARRVSLRAAAAGEGRGSAPSPTSKPAIPRHPSLRHTRAGGSGAVGSGGEGRASPGQSAGPSDLARHGWHQHNGAAAGGNGRDDRSFGRQDACLRSARGAHGSERILADFLGGQ